MPLDYHAEFYTTGMAQLTSLELYTLEHPQTSNVNATREF